MKIWLTVAEASRYSGASKERVGPPQAGGETETGARPLTGRRQHGHGDGC